MSDLAIEHVQTPLWLWATGRVAGTEVRIGNELYVIDNSRRGLYAWHGAEILMAPPEGVYDFSFNMRDLAVQHIAIPWHDPHQSQYTYFITIPWDRAIVTPSNEHPFGTVNDE